MLRGEPVYSFLVFVRAEVWSGTFCRLSEHWTCGQGSILGSVWGYSFAFSVRLLFTPFLSFSVCIRPMRVVFFIPHFPLYSLDEDVDEIED